MATCSTTTTKPTSTAERNLQCAQEALLNQLHSGVMRTRYDGRGEVQFTSVDEQLRVLNLVRGQQAALAGQSCSRFRTVLTPNRGYGGGR